MLALARESLPEWTDFSENDLGVLLVELFAYACDITLYYQTRIASNLLPATADEPEALVQLLRFIGYELHPPTPAVADLRLTFNASEVAGMTTITIPAGTKFTVSLSSGQQLSFESASTTQIHSTQLTPPDARGLQYFSPLTVVEGQTVLNEAVAVSDGTPNQAYRLQQSPVIPRSLQVTVTEASGTIFWQEVSSLANSGPTDRHFVVQRDAAGGATLVFGDNNNGMMLPRGTNTQPVTIEASYRVGGGPAGNVPANTRFTPPPFTPTIQAATNLQAASGGAASEDVDRARQLAPHLFRTQERAVTTQDYTDLALQVPGVVKAKAVPIGWNQVVLYVASAGQLTDPSELLQRDIQAFFETRRMAGTTLSIQRPEIADIYLAAVVRTQPYFLQSDVRAAIERVVSDYLSFENVDFGQQIYLSKVYDIIQNLPQVVSLTVYKFSRNPILTQEPDIAEGGIIFLKPNELPRLGYRDNPASFSQIPDAIPTPIVLTIQGAVAPGRLGQ